MARHGKKRATPNGVRVIAVIGSVLVLVLLLCLVAVKGGWLDAVATMFATDSTTTTTGTTTTTATESITTTTVPDPGPQFRHPETMKGVWITPGSDYLTGNKTTAANLKKQIDEAFVQVEAWGFNTLLLPLHKGEQALYPSEILETLTFQNADGTVFDPIAYIIGLARAKGLFVYGIVDLHVQDEALGDPRKAADLTVMVRNAAEQVNAYDFDGYFLSDFAYGIGQLPKAETADAGPELDSLMEQAVTAIRQRSRDLYVGLLSTGVWAHASVDQRGSQTGEYYEEMTDGRADTRQWVQDGWFDCVMVQNYTSTSHPTAPFQNVLEWWGNVVGDTPLYISHSANTIGSYKAGWKLTDQMAQQYLYCKAEPAWQGSAYDTLKALVNDQTGIAETLKKAYAGTLNEAFLYKTLTVSAPSKLKFTTTASTVKFEGGGDTNFPLTINGTSVELTEHGFFTESFPLEIGVNTFVFSHKGVTRTYTVTYQQTLLERVSPAEDMRVEGENLFVISAIARKGSTVTAVLNGTTVELTEVPNKDDESGGEESDFATFSGSLTLPKGTVGKATSLGAVTITAAYNGISESLIGGTITVEALPVPTTTTTTRPPSSGTTGTTRPSGGEYTPTLPEGNREIVEITADYAESFNGGSASDDYSRPYNSYLPAGTWDYLAGKVYNGSLSYYSLASGKRVYMKDAKVVNGGELPVQQLKGGEVAVTDSHTVFTFESDWYVPVYIKAESQQYYRDTTTGTPNYGIEKYGQTATFVEVTFHYVNEAPAAPDMTGNPLFSKAEWIAGTGDTYVLKLSLRKTGGYYGVSFVWENGELTLSFLNPANVTQNTGAEKLKGVRILIDPGHGSSNDKPWEAPFNLEYANTLKDKLEALGATVDMTRTGPLTTDLTLAQRTAMANNGGYHLFISVHMNGANGKATGATVWYYYEYAYTVSRYLYDRMHAVETTYGVGTTQNGTPRASGTNWGTLYLNRTIHDCPAVLLECAFLDNPKDKEALIDPVYRDKLMQAVTDGVVQYFVDQSA